jgi:hypothetical protein
MATGKVKASQSGKSFVKGEQEQRQLFSLFLHGRQLPFFLHQLVRTLLVVIIEDSVNAVHCIKGLNLTAEYFAVGPSNFDTLADKGFVEAT